MTFIYDVQIIAAVYALKNWKTFIESFIDSLYHSEFPRMLATMKIVWLAPDKNNRLEILAKTYPTYFEYKGNTLICRKAPKDVYNAFLATLPQEIQSNLANCIAPSLG